MKRTPPLVRQRRAFTAQLNDQIDQLETAARGVLTQLDEVCVNPTLATLDERLIAATAHGILYESLLRCRLVVRGIDQLATKEEESESNYATPQG